MQPNSARAIQKLQIAAEVSTEVSSGSGAQTEAGRKTKQAIEAACKALLAAENELTEMDRVTGDGDLGVSMARGAKAVQDAVASYPLDNIPLRLKRSVILSGVNWVDPQDRSMESCFCAAAVFLRLAAQPDWRSGQKRSIRGAGPSVNWVAQSQAIAPCWMRSIHS